MTNSASKESKKPRPRKKVAGDVLKIDLGDGAHSYGHVAEHGQVIFYDYRSQLELPIHDIVRLPIAFRVWVYDSALKGDRWQKIGHIDLPPALLQEPDTFKQDPVSGRLSIYHRRYASTNYERPAILSECRNLERTAVWEAEHVEDRLRDHFAGVENAWVRQLLIDESKVPPDQRM